jgi:hypothetical protein
MSNIVKRDGFDAVHSSRPGGRWFTCKKGHWLVGGGDVDPEERVAVLLTTWEGGEIRFGDDHKVKELHKHLVAEHGLYGKPQPGYSRHTSVMVVDTNGCLGTFTSTSFGGGSALEDLIPQYRMQQKRSFPICSLATKDRGDQYGNIDPVFPIVGWASRSKFDAILGPEPEEKPAIAAPEPKPEPAAKRKAADIIDDSIPF